MSTVPSGPAARLTGRGAVLGMVVVFGIGLAGAAWLGWAVLGGLAFLVGTVAAARYTRQPDLLTVVVTPPLLFFCAAVCVRALTASGNVLLSVAEGSLLTLGGAAPWIFAGMILGLVIALFRGLPQCIRDLRRDLHPGPAHVRAAGYLGDRGERGRSPRPDSGTGWNTGTGGPGPRPGS